MLPYFATILIYLLSFPLAFQITQSLAASLLIKLVLTGSALFYFKKDFKFSIKYDHLSVFVGFIIFLFWVFLDGLYPMLGTITELKYSLIDIIMKFTISIAFAPVIEEFFTRFFLMRWVIDKNWEKVKLGKYTLQSFFITIIFFGFSHERWLAGLIAGILLNLLLYKRKTIESVIVAHAAANFFLGLFVVSFQAWQFW